MDDDTPAEASETMSRAPSRNGPVDLAVGSRRPARRAGAGDALTPEATR
ncbi:hypothetical protein [Halobellus clavatus]|nr:hypothetical protein [Halobellus clavatus]